MTSAVEPIQNSDPHTTVASPLTESLLRKPSKKSSIKSNTPAVSKERIERERLKLERRLKHYEKQYWQRSKGSISLEEKERLREPLIETKEKLKKLSDSPDRYFKEKYKPSQKYRSRSRTRRETMKKRHIRVSR